MNVRTYRDAARSQTMDDALSFAVHSAALSVHRAYRQILRPLGLTYPKYLVMQALWDCDELSVSEVGDRLFLDSGTTTPLLKKLESSGLLVRRRSTTDERRVIVTLTEAGRALQPACSSVTERVSHTMKLNQSQVASLRSDLEQLRNNLFASAVTEAS